MNAENPLPDEIGTTQAQTNTEVLSITNTENLTKKDKPKRAPMKLKTIHEQKNEQGSKAAKDPTSDEIIDEKLMKMLNKPSNWVYDDSELREYHQVFDKKRLHEDAWRSLNVEDKSAYKAIKSKHFVTTDQKQNEITLERCESIAADEENAYNKFTQKSDNVTLQNQSLNGSLNLSQFNAKNAANNAGMINPVFKLNINKKNIEEINKNWDATKNSGIVLLKRDPESLKENDEFIENPEKKLKEDEKNSENLKPVKKIENVKKNLVSDYSESESED